MGKNGGALLGTVAFAAIGGLTGGLFAPGAFSMLGASVGVMIGGALFAQPQPSGFSSVRDLRANKAEPTFLPIWCGDDIDDPDRPGQTLEGGAILPGIIIKVAPDGGITRVTKKSKSGGGGTAGRLFGGPSSTEEEYFLSCAIAWGEGSTAHPGRCREMWADEKLVFDLDAGADEDGHIETTPITDAQGREVGWQAQNIRHYYGTGTQPVDDIVEAWYVAEGLHAPAFRGCEYTVVTNFKIDGHVTNFYGRHTNGIKARREQCRFFLLRSNGLDGDVVIPPDALNLTKMNGQSRAWYMTQQGAPAEVAQLIASRDLCALVEHSYRIHDIDLRDPAIHTLEDWELAAQSEGGDGEARAPRFRRGLDDGRQKPSRVEVRFFDIRKRDENSVPAIMPTATYESVQTFDLPTVDTEEEIAVWGAIMMDAAWVSEPGAVSTLPRRVGATAGDVLRVPVKGRPGEFTDILAHSRTLAAPGAIEFEGTRWSAETYRNRPTLVPTPRAVESRTWAAPILFVSNTVCLNDGMMDVPGVVFAATQTPNYRWEKGCETRWEVQSGSGWDEFDSHITETRAVMGQLLSPWETASPYAGYVADNPMVVEMFWGDLVTAPIDRVRTGANVLLFECGLVVSFAAASPTGLTEYGLGRYALSLIKCGRFGSDDLRPAVLPAGARFIVLRDEDGVSVSERSVEFYSIGFSRRGKTVRALGNTPEKRAYVTTRAFTYGAENVVELQPVGVAATRESDGALRLRGRARSRYPDNETGWSSSLVQLSAPRRSQGYPYQIELWNGAQLVTLTRYTQDDGGSFDFALSAAELANLFGSVPAHLTGTVALQGRLCLGRKRSWET